MKYLFTTAAFAATLALAIPATAQNSAPGTSVQTGTAASNGKNSGTPTDAMANDSMMNDTSMHHSMKKKPMKHASKMSGHAMATSDTKAVTTGPYGTSMNGGTMDSTHPDMSPGMVGKAGGKTGGTKTGN